MELVNKNYVRLDTFEVGGEYLDALENGEEKKAKYFQKLSSAKAKYESENRTYIGNIFIRIDDESFANLRFNVMEIPIKRVTLVNAFFIASYCFNIEMQTKLAGLLSQDYVLPKELDEEVLEYILNNSMDIYDFLNDRNREYFVYRNGEELTKGTVFKRTNLDTPHNLNAEDVGAKRLSFTNNQIQYNAQEEN